MLTFNRAVSAASTDFLLAAIPMYLFWKLRIDRFKKVALFSKLALYFA